MPRSIVRHLELQDEPLRNLPSNPATSCTLHYASSAGSTYPPPHCSSFRPPSPRFFAWLPPCRRARNSLPFTVLPFRSRLPRIPSTAHHSPTFTTSTTTPP